MMVLQTSLFDKTAEEIYELYKKRSKKETYFNYLKNTADYNALHLPDYYKIQDLAFIMLVEALIYHDFQTAVKEVKGKSIRDCLLDARTIKIHKRKDDYNWQICNCKKSILSLFEQLHTPMTVESLPT